MHRLIAISILLFWAILFVAFAHVSLSSHLQGDTASGVDLQLLLTGTSQYPFLPVIMLVVAAVFGWAILALIASDEDHFREIEAYAYAAAIIAMSVATLLALVEFGFLVFTPAVLMAALCASIASSRFMDLQRATINRSVLSRDSARLMAMGAAHNSMLSRVSGRHFTRSAPSSAQVSLFALKPRNHQTSPRSDL